MIKSGQWALRIPRSYPPGLSIPKQRRFDHRMQMVRVFINQGWSMGELAGVSKRRGWADRNITRQAMYFHLASAVRWLTQHGCLVKRGEGIKP